MAFISGAQLLLNFPQATRIRLLIAAAVGNFAPPSGARLFTHRRVKREVGVLCHLRKVSPTLPPQR